MAMRTGTATGLPIEEEDGDADIAVVGTDEMVRAPHKGQVFLTDAVHREPAPGGKQNRRAAYRTGCRKKGPNQKQFRVQAFSAAC
jgi:hypothetical protein